MMNVTRSCLALVLLLVYPVAACPPPPELNPCEALHGDDDYRGERVILIGRVLNIKEKDSYIQMQIDVVEGLLGLAGHVRTVHIELYKYGLLCDELPATGDTRLFFAWRHADKANRSDVDILQIDDCDASVVVDKRPNLLRAVRDAIRGDSLSIIGTVFGAEVREMPVGSSGEPAPIVGATVTATNGDHSLRTTSDANGEFHFRLPASGSWTLDVEPDAFALPFHELYAPEVLVAEGCGYQNLILRPNGRIGGTVRDFRGQPIEGMIVNAYVHTSSAFDYPAASARTAADGSYQLRGLSAGNYILGLNTSLYHGYGAYESLYYPNAPRFREATPLTLLTRGELVGVNLTAPPPRVANTLALTVTHQDGQPVSWFTVQVTDESHRVIERTSKGSQIELPVYSGGTYSLFVRARERRDSSDSDFLNHYIAVVKPLPGDNQSFVIVVEPEERPGQ